MSDRGSREGEQIFKAKKKRRQYAVEEKLRIQEEAREPGTTVAEVLRRHQADGTTYYRWERQASEGMREALKGKRRDRGAKDRAVKRLRGEVQEKSRIIAEVVEENLRLSKALPPNASLRRNGAW